MSVVRAQGATVLPAMPGINRYSGFIIRVAAYMGRGKRPTKDVLYQLSYVGI
ncbi:MAG TPA: hypothetical protein VJH91_01370 [Candidatus Paceibacterota bacterium]